MLQPRLPSFFKIPSNNRFEYNPRYFDPAKEELEERTRLSRGESIQYKGTDDLRSRMAHQFKNARNPSSVSHQKNQSNIRLIIILIFLLLLAVILFKVL